MKGSKEMSKSAKRVFCIALVLILVSCIFASLIQTDFGKVQITTVNIVTDSGSTLCGHLYRPKDATAENPLPGIVTCHGNYNNKEMQDVNAIELSRRGHAARQGGRVRLCGRVHRRGVRGVV